MTIAPAEYFDNYLQAHKCFKTHAAYFFAEIEAHAVVAFARVLFYRALSGTENERHCRHYTTPGLSSTSTPHLPMVHYSTPTILPPFFEMHHHLAL